MHLTPIIDCSSSYSICWLAADEYGCCFDDDGGLLWVFSFAWFVVSFGVLFEWFSWIFGDDGGLFDTRARFKLILVSDCFIFLFLSLPFEFVLATFLESLNWVLLFKLFSWIFGDDNGLLWVFSFAWFVVSSCSAIFELFSWIFGDVVGLF